MMKKVFLCLIAALLTAALLLSCSSGGDITLTTGDLSPVPSPEASAEDSAFPVIGPTESAQEGEESVFSPIPLPSAPPSPSGSWTPVVNPVFRTEQAFIYDVEMGCFRYISGEDRIIYPASTTKLLTILYALTLLEDPSQRITPGNELTLVQPHSSIAYIKSHHVLTVEQLVEGMLLPSGNDAAYVLAAAAGKVLDPDAKDGKEAVAAFMVGMNTYAKRLGLMGSNFVNPDGYDNENHYSTLEDMAIVAIHAYSCSMIRKYCNMETDDVVYASGHKMTWQNTNINLWKGTRYYSPYVNGLKTGSVSSEYYCLLSSAEINGKAFIFGFFGEPNSDARFEDTLTAIAWVKKYAL